MARGSVGLVFLACLVLCAVAQPQFCTAESGVEPFETLVDEINGPYSLQIAQLPPDNEVRPRSGNGDCSMH